MTTQETQAPGPDESRERWINLAITAAAVLFVILFWHNEKVRTSATLVIILGILVFIHELGHFMAARWSRVRVIEFAFGFGPRLMTYMRRGGTDFTLRAIPLGGFVNMPGMMPDEVDVEGGLAGKPAGARALVFFAGPLMNLILALVILCSVGFVIGTPTGKDVYVGEVVPKTPAQRMGLKVGDQILSVAGVPINGAEQLVKLVQNRPAVDTELVVKRGSEILTLHGTPDDQYDDQLKKHVRRFGISPFASLGPRLSLGESLRVGWASYRGSFMDLWQLFSQPRQLVRQVGGPVEMYRATQARSKLPLLANIDLLCRLSISLAVFNLLPIPVLDGGHLMLLAVEVLRRRRLTPNAVKIAHMIGLAVIGVIFVLIMYKDLTRPGG
jgi:regulator of sigma E protease